MSGMMDRAAALFGRKAKGPDAEPFSIRCSCGKRVQGLRRREHQTVECEQCSAAVFVLPLSPLAPPGPQKKAKKSASASATKNSPSKNAASKRSGEKKPLDSKAVEELFEMEPEERPVRKRPAILDRPWLKDEPEEEEKLPRKPWLNRNQTIGVAGVFTVVMIGVAAYRQLEYRNLRDQLPGRARSGMQLLQEGKFDEAYEPLRLADKAVGWWRIPFPDAKAVRQAFAEASVVRELSPEPLEQLVESARQDPSGFARRYAGKVLLLDLEVAKDPEGGWRQRMEIPIGSEMLELDPAGLTLYSDLGVETYKRVIFAARIAGLRHEEAGWVLTLTPDSGLAVTNSALLRLMGTDTEPAADAVRKAQKEWVEEVR